MEIRNVIIVLFLINSLFVFAQKKQGKTLSNIKGFYGKNDDTRLIETKKRAVISAIGKAYEKSGLPIHYKEQFIEKVTANSDGGVAKKFTMMIDAIGTNISCTVVYKGVTYYDENGNTENDEGKRHKYKISGELQTCRPNAICVNLKKVTITMKESEFELSSYKKEQTPPPSVQTYGYAYDNKQKRENRFFMNYLISIDSASIASHKGMIGIGIQGKKKRGYTLLYVSAFNKKLSVNYVEDFEITLGFSGGAGYMTKNRIFSFWLGAGVVNYNHYWNSENLEDYLAVEKYPRNFYYEGGLMISGTNSFAFSINTGFIGGSKNFHISYGLGLIF